MSAPGRVLSHGTAPVSPRHRSRAARVAEPGCAMRDAVLSPPGPLGGGGSPRWGVGWIAKGES